MAGEDVPGGGVISPVLKAIIGLVSQDDGPSIADISKDISDMRYDFATAVGLFKNVIAFILVVGTNLIARRISGEGIW